MSCLLPTAGTAELVHSSISVWLVQRYGYVCVPFTFALKLQFRQLWCLQWATNVFHRMPRFVRHFRLLRTIRAFESKSQICHSEPNGFIVVPWRPWHVLHELMLVATFIVPYIDNHLRWRLVRPNFSRLEQALTQFCSNICLCFAFYAQLDKKWRQKCCPFPSAFVTTSLHRPTRRNNSTTPHV
jgi:hypothetical protein